MKKIALMFVACVMCVATFAQNKIIVQNAEKVTIFDDLTTAIKSAVAGDTLYLSDGTYEAVTLNKLLYFRGTGKSAINGNFNLEIGANPTPTDALMEGLDILGQLNVTKKITNLTIRQCKFKTSGFNADMPNALIDRCYVTEKLNLNAFTNELTIRNTKVYDTNWSDTGNNGCTFINCNIYGDSNHKYYAGTFKNCIFGKHPNYYNLYFRNSSIVNTLIAYYGSDDIHIESSSTSSNVYEVYYRVDDKYVLNSNCESEINLKEKGYVGDDGTEVGIYGGSTPFDLNPAVPQIASASIQVDQNAKKLKIQLEVVAE